MSNSAVAAVEEKVNALKKDEDYLPVLALLIPLPRQQRERLWKLIADRTGAGKNTVKKDFADVEKAELANCLLYTSDGTNGLDQ
jgi:hypothetical protein